LLDVLIIGAGPYGLSLAACLREAGVDVGIFGKPMVAWKNHMPPGMLLKSHAWASCLYDTSRRFTLERYCAERGIAYAPQLSIPLESFVAYAEAFQAHFALDVRPKLLSLLEPVPQGYRATFDDGEVVLARRVVMAVGVHPFKHIPDALQGLPAHAVSHSGDHGPLDAFAGKHVTVIGSGASATDVAALLHEKGASVALVARASKLRFMPPVASGGDDIAHRLARSLRSLIRPVSGIGVGWPLKVWADAPWVFHRLPAALRTPLVRKTLGPLGHMSTKDRVVGKVAISLRRRLRSAETVGDKVRLELATQNGLTETLETDHVVAATGYRIDLGRLGFLDPRLRAGIRTSGGGSPVLSTHYETSMPGLYVIGPASADSFGPVARFVFGVKHPSRHLTRHLAAAVAETSRPAPKALGEAEAVLS
jgi:cation diffusion facilitator CzcD-associated flavoprotein CzcO